ncbi:MAG: 2-hydroxymuconic semialdehyde hydrolase [Alphaproteobacteria bacterium 65-37]|jgi:pimeloyl-ACP methyl ester carboxylesterase|nr:MAG: 2-hydroxymuconic semialdehyde hydrolase [Alphaproteobacteria bacterium 65-37]
MIPILFLPGTGASPDFWKPVGERLPSDWPKAYFGWPGLGDQPPDPSIQGYDDLKRLVAARMNTPVDLVAQSMGGVIAARLAIEQPEKIRRLVLCTTSGGVDMQGFGAGDWRADYRKSYPNAAAWVTAQRSVPPEPVEKIAAPTLLIWGDADPISPVAVGWHLEQRLSNAKLEIVAGGNHDLARTHADQVARLIAAHLG